MRKYLLLLFLCLIILNGCSSHDGEILLEDDGYTGMDEVPDPERSVSTDMAEYIREDKTDEPQHICVYICGEIEKPGVYELLDGSRLYELINKAGGLSEKASESFLNQAEVLSDGQKVYVPSVLEVSKGTVTADGDTSGADKNRESGSSPVNINSAGVDELCSISGIGESRARDIVAYREANGAFSRVEDIMKVSGIKNGLFEKIKAQITVK